MNGAAGFALLGLLCAMGFSGVGLAAVLAGIAAIQWWFRKSEE